MATDTQAHICSRMPRMAGIDYNKRLKQFELILMKRFKEGKIEPKLYTIKVPINFCPFCSENLDKESTPHLESCNCTLCMCKKIDKDEVKL